MAYWLVKSEPSVYSIGDLRRDRSTLWTGVRNYQARNYLRSMTKGDEVLFYHSNNDVTGIAGIAKVSAPAEADESQFDAKSEYYDPKATKEEPRWFAPEIRFVKAFARIVELAELKKVRALSKMELLRKGSRLSVQPVTPDEFEQISALADGDPVRK